MAETPSLAGTSVVHFTNAVRTLYGDDVVRAGLDRLPDESRRTIAEATTVGWIPNVHFGLAIEAWAGAARVPIDELVRKAARLATKESFGTVFRVFLRLTSDEALIARTPMIFSKTRNVGALNVARFAPGSATLVLSKWPEVSDRQVTSIESSIETLLEMTGRSHPVVRGRREADGAVFELRWGRSIAPPAR